MALHRGSQKFQTSHRRGVGDLVLVYKRISGLAGHTSRVSELLESVNRLSSGDPVETRRCGTPADRGVGGN